MELKSRDWYILLWADTIGIWGVHLVMWRCLECVSGDMESWTRENLGDKRLHEVVEGIQEFEGLSLNDTLDFFRAALNSCARTKGCNLNSYKSWFNFRKTVSLLK